MCEEAWRSAKKFEGKYEGEIIFFFIFPIILFNSKITAYVCNGSK